MIPLLASFSSNNSNTSECPALAAAWRDVLSAYKNDQKSLNCHLIIRQNKDLHLFGLESIKYNVLYSVYHTREVTPNVELACPTPLSS